MFTTPCFIRKNTAGLRRKLRKMGYAKCMTIGNGKSYITISNNNDERNGSYSIVSADVVNNIGFRKPHIDCGDNEDLFLAIAALRDDSNEHQWFVWDDDKNDGDKWKLYDYNPSWSWWIFEVHKATVDELIEHFK